jgi:phospholipid/cholesterol/gamma-HCH transport system substrate-binding protein
VNALADVTGVLVRQQRAIIDILDVTPLALSNLNLAYNARSGTLDTRDNAMGPYDPASYVCSLMVDTLSATQVPQECSLLAQTLNAHKMPMPDQLRRLVGLPPGTSPAQAGQPAAAGQAGSPAGAGQPAGSVASNDSTRGGILRGRS